MTACQCFLHYRTYNQTPVDNRENSFGLPWHLWGLIFKELSPKDLLAASTVCKLWRFVAAKECIDPLADNLKSISCFSNFWNDFTTSRHIFLFDVSGSMTNAPASMVNAKKIFGGIVDFLDPIIQRRGLRVCKFADNHVLEYFHSRDGVEAFLDDRTGIDTDGTNLIAAIQTVYDQVITLRPKNTHIYVISDMLLSLDDTIFNKEKLDKVSRVTFHFYNAKEDAQDAFLKETEEEYVKMNGSVSNHLGMHFYRQAKAVKTNAPAIKNND